MNYQKWKVEYEKAKQALVSIEKQKPAGYALFESFREKCKWTSGSFYMEDEDVKIEGRGIEKTRWTTKKVLIFPRFAKELNTLSFEERKEFWQFCKDYNSKYDFKDFRDKLPTKDLYNAVKKLEKENDGSITQ